MIVPAWPEQNPNDGGEKLPTSEGLHEIKEHEKWSGDVFQKAFYVLEKTMHRYRIRSLRRSLAPDRMF